MGRRGKRVLVGVVFGCVVVGVAGTSARAFDFFGLWPSEDAGAPVSANAIAYEAQFVAHGEDSSLVQAMRDASGLYGLRRDAPPDGDSLARRAAADFAPLIDALWAKGYFNAKLTIAIDDATIAPGGDTSAFAHAAERYRGRASAPIKVVVDSGPLFRVRSLAVFGPDGRTPLANLPSRVMKLAPGDPAVADAVRAAESRIVDYFRAQARPLAKIVSVRPVVDHPALALDVAMTVDPGPVARLGGVTIKSPSTIPESVVRSFVYLEAGEPYSPQVLERNKRSVQTIPAVGGVKFVEGTTLDSGGDLPLELDVTDRPAHAFGASAQYSTTDGPFGQVYWENRNLFGAAEYLRLQADLLYAPANLGAVPSVGSLGHSNVGGRLSAHFIKPALGGSRNDLLIDATAERVGSSFGKFVGYTVDDVDLSAAIRHRFSDRLSAQIGIETQKGFATDVLGTVNYRLVGIPVSVLYDSTDDRLDPKHGFRAAARIAPYPRIFGSSLDLVTGRTTLSAYQALDEDERYVVAGRVEVGGETGAPLAQVPANMRFYAGGGGSVRGFNYYSLGPLGPGGAVIGGRSVFAASLELRAKVTDTIGIVPFVDTGNAFASPLPNFSAPLRVSGGLGLRYYTSFGPLRLDVAAPLNRRPGDPRFAVYVGIGQAF